MASRAKKQPRITSYNVCYTKLLRTRPAVIKIGKVLFVHAGISSDLIKLKIPVDTINHIITGFQEQMCSNPFRKCEETEQIYHFH